VAWKAEFRQDVFGGVSEVLDEQKFLPFSRHNDLPHPSIQLRRIALAS